MVWVSAGSALHVLRVRHPFRAAIGAAVLVGAIGSCVTNVRYESVPLAGPRVVRSPVKAHLVDGSTIVFSDGITIDNSLVTGDGARYDIRLNPVGAVPGVALDSVLAMESFRTETDVIRSISSVYLHTAAGALLAAAIFGSCPTVYSDGTGVELLEAEAFSYSIAPLFESRDVDRLAVGVDDQGEVRLEVRNEALETHYINHFELIEVGHASHEQVVPDPEGRPVRLGSPLALQHAADRDGRDVTELLSRPDGILYTSSVSRIENAIASVPGEVEDHIELDLTVPLGTGQIGLHLRLRNSLLATVLFYDMMLGDRGARALDWLGQDLGEIGPAVELGQWAADNLGMRISVLESGTWREVARIPDKGPLAWDDVAVVVPVSPDRTEASVRIRLAFPADHWRIDHVTPFETARYAEGRVVPLSMIQALDGSDQTDMLANLASADDSYLVTSPGHAFEVVFRPGVDARQDGRNRSRTFFLASQGYYIEWVRQSWLAAGRETEPFRPGPETLVEALRRWHAARDTMEEQFYATRIPVR
ncbi:MAG: hypothetical protein F4X13_15495 [Gammaproteobacteria bacterium]|nr:hypothetical protein [Gammaproteobacteria bacterium]